jgi:K+-transporting ATPase A subunit
MDKPPLTLVHVIIGLIGIASGFIVMFGMFAEKRQHGWTAIFLVFTILISVTGFVFFPSKKSRRVLSQASCL